MAFQVKDLMVTLEPARVACGKTEGQCPTASATIVFACGDTEAHCHYPSMSASPGSRKDLELLRRALAERVTH